jgi:hypothetical protein
MLISSIPSPNYKSAGLQTKNEIRIGIRTEKRRNEPEEVIESAVSQVIDGVENVVYKEPGIEADRFKNRLAGAGPFHLHLVDLHFLLLFLRLKPVAVILLGACLVD